jgi:uncharacterized membrane protein
MDTFTYRLLFAVLYFVVDTTYVYSSSSYYQKYIKRVQKEPQDITKKGFYLSAGIAYIFLCVGWWIFISERLTKNSSLYDILRLTIPYSLAIYGVFNTTLYVMFKDWDMNVALRDTLWGVSSITLISIAYVYFSKTI